MAGNRRLRWNTPILGHCSVLLKTPVLLRVYVRENYSTTFLGTLLLSLRNRRGGDFRVEDAPWERESRDKRGCHHTQPLVCPRCALLGAERSHSTAKPLSEAQPSRGRTPSRPAEPEGRRCFPTFPSRGKTQVARLLLETQEIKAMDAHS